MSPSPDQNPKLGTKILLPFFLIKNSYFPSHKSRSFQSTLDDATDAWGVKVERVEVTIDDDDDDDDVDDGDDDDDGCHEDERCECA